MKLLIQATLILAGIIHLLPIPGALGASHLTQIYGLPFDEPNLLVMMRHRAILFGLLGAFLIYAAFRPELFWIAIAGGIISAAAFIWLAWSVSGYNDSIARIIIADMIAVACLIVAAVCQTISKYQS